MLAVVSLVAACVLLGLLQQRRIPLEGDAVAVLVDHVQCAQHVERIVDASLHVLEVKFLPPEISYLTMFRALYMSRIWFAIYRESAIFVYVRAGRLFLSGDLLKHFLRKEDELLVVGGAFLALDLGFGQASKRVSTKDILELLVFFFGFLFGLGLYLHVVGRAYGLSRGRPLFAPLRHRRASPHLERNHVWPPPSRA